MPKEKMESELPLKPIYDEALIGYVYLATNPRCFLSKEDEEKGRIPVYDLEKVDEIHWQDLKKRMPDLDDDELSNIHAEELDWHLRECRAIYVQENK